MKKKGKLQQATSNLSKQIFKFAWGSFKLGISLAILSVVVLIVWAAFSH